MKLRNVVGLGVSGSLFVMMALGGCASDADNPENSPGTGGATGGTGGATGGTGGATGGTGGATGGTGGATGGTGGATGGTGGATGGTGGATGGTGGATGGTGGATGGTGGATGGTGGAPPETATIGELRAKPDGELATPILIEGVYVTYTRKVGFYVQVDRTGPGIFVYSGESSAQVAVGNQIDLRVTSLASFHGLKEVAGFTIESNDNGAYDVAANLVQPVEAALAETDESELFHATGITITGGAAPNFTATVGTAAVPISFYSYEGAALNLCIGAKLDSIGVVEDYDGAYSLRSFHQTDATHVDNAVCTAPTMDNWDLEDWSSTNPPPGFSKTTSAQIANYSMNRGTENHTAGGQYSAQLTWTTTDNVDIAPLYKYPVTPGTAYTCSAWFLDNDPAGRARLAMSFQLSTGAVDTAYSTSYTADNASWTQQTYERVAPADAVSMTCLIRLYDVGTPFTSATIHFDDLSITP